MIEGQKVKLANPESSIHHAIALWAPACAERALPIFEELRHGEDRPRGPVEGLREWERGELPMTACRTSAFAAHSAAREAAEAGELAAVAAAGAAGQACATAHMLDHSEHAATYAAKTIGPLDGGKGAHDAERDWQWENLARELRVIGFPKRL